MYYGREGPLVESYRIFFGEGSNNISSNNVCLDWWIMNHHISASLGRFSDFSDVGAPPFSDDGYLWESFDITVGLDDAGDQPSDEVVLRWLTNQ
jgi:hypothetical protein